MTLDRRFTVAVPPEHLPDVFVRQHELGMAPVQHVPELALPPVWEIQVLRLHVRVPPAANTTWNDRAHSQHGHGKFNNKDDK